MHCDFHMIPDFSSNMPLVLAYNLMHVQRAKVRGLEARFRYMVLHIFLYNFILFEIFVTSQRNASSSFPVQVIGWTSITQLMYNGSTALYVLLVTLRYSWRRYWQSMIISYRTGIACKICISYCTFLLGNGDERLLDNISMLSGTSLQCLKCFFVFFSRYAIVLFG